MSLTNELNSKSLALCQQVIGLADEVDVQVIEL